MISVGTFGTCQLAKFRNIDAVVKQFKSNTAEKQKWDVLHKAKVISRLGDRRGLPLLSGVQTSQLAYSLILQFHGDKKQSLTIYRAAWKKLTPNEWKGVINRVTESLHHTHKGYLHNYLKANSVIHEKREDSYNAAVNDFGKSTKIDVPRENKQLSKADQKACWQSFPHITPEIVSSTRHQTTASNVYCLAKMVSFICSNLSFLRTLPYLNSQRQDLSTSFVSNFPLIFN